MLEFKITYDKEFIDLLKSLDEKMLDIEGISCDKLDLNKYARDFFEGSENVADVSIDPNANVSYKDVVVFRKEITKPFFKLNFFYNIWKKAKELYGVNTANKMVKCHIDGDIYINDATECLPYCFNFSAYDIAINGLPFVNKIKSLPPKHLKSFKNQLINFLAVASNHILGATGIADFLIVSSIYVDKILRTKQDSNVYFKSEDDIWRYVKEELVSFIYTINQPLRISEAPFVNVSVFDSIFLDKLCGDYKIPEVGEAKKDIVKKVQQIFLEAMNEELERTPITFPVITACFSKDKYNNIIDKEFLDFISEQNLKYGFINIYIGETHTLSSCCFDGSQKCLTRSSNGINLMSFKDLFNADYDKTKKNFTIFHNGSWVKGKLIKTKNTSNYLYEITTENNKKIIVTHDHLHPTLEGDKKTTDLTTDDYLLFNSLKLNKICSNSENLNCGRDLTYEQGYLIGLYLGDGSAYKRKDYNCYEIVFSLNQDKVDKSLPIIRKALRQFGIEKDVNVYFTENNIVSVTIYDEDLFNTIKYFVKGSYSYEKEINIDVLEYSTSFRQGIIDGWYASDGGNSNRIYTTSKLLVEQMEAVFTSLGYVTTIDVSDRTGDGVVVIRNQSFNRNYPVFCIRWYDCKNKRKMKDIYVIKNNSIYFKIKEIKKIDCCKDKDVYCFEMFNEDEPYFTLPNGIITHNCRLRSSIKGEYQNSFGAGSVKIGSIGVVTINLPRLAYLSKKQCNYSNCIEEVVDLFKHKLEDYVRLAAKINNTRRMIIKRRIELNTMPLYTYGYIDLKKQYSTVGIVGLSEALEMIGVNIKTDEGLAVAKDIMSTLNILLDKLDKEYNYWHNIEQVPAETSAVTLAKKDRILYGLNYKVYSNQFIPLWYNVDLFDRIITQGELDSLFSGGAILHLNINEQIDNPETMKWLINACAKKGVIYFAINYILGLCKNGHFVQIPKDSITCSVCGAEIVDTFTRVVGFLVNTKNFNKVRKEVDYPNRVFYNN